MMIVGIKKQKSKKVMKKIRLMVIEVQITKKKKNKKFLKNLKVKKQKKLNLIQKINRKH